MDSAVSPERHRRSDAQALPRPYSPPVAHLGSSGLPWHELQEQPSPHSDTSDPWEEDRRSDELRPWHADAAHEHSG